MSQECLEGEAREIKFPEPEQTQIPSLDSGQDAVEVVCESLAEPPEVVCESPAEPPDSAQRAGDSRRPDFIDRHIKAKKFGFGTVFSPEKAKELKAGFEAQAESAPEWSDICPYCFGTGWEPHESGRGVVRCRCINEAEQEMARLSRSHAAMEKIKGIPTKLQHVLWSNLAPCVERFQDQHRARELIEMQQRNIHRIKANPKANFFFYGNSGNGKSACMVALFRRALAAYGPDYCYMFSAAEYLRTLRETEFSSGQVKVESPLIDLDVLRQKDRRCFVGLDELSRAGTRVTPFGADQIADLLDAVTYWGPPGEGHQLVIASQFGAADLMAYWAQGNAASAEAIMRRALEGTEEVSFVI